MDNTGFTGAWLAVVWVMGGALQVLGLNLRKTDSYAANSEDMVL
jgi:hypothetical protein